jgi:hypothetical protein
MTQKNNCLIHQNDCERKIGNPICPKCGIDERIIYPSEADRDAAQTAARAQYWENHARKLEKNLAQDTHGPAPVKQTVFNPDPIIQSPPKIPKNSRSRLPEYEMNQSPRKEMTQNPVRPTSITVVCVLMVLGALVPLVQASLMRRINDFQLLHLGLTVAIGLACAVGLWMMKKWAAHIYLGAVALNQIFLLTLGGWNIFTLLGPAIVLFFAFRHISKMS